MIFVVLVVILVGATVGVAPPQAATSTSCNINNSVLIDKITIITKVAVYPSIRSRKQK